MWGIYDDSRLTNSRKAGYVWWALAGTTANWRSCCSWTYSLLLLNFILSSFLCVTSKEPKFLAVSVFRISTPLRWLGIRKQFSPVAGLFTRLSSTAVTYNKREQRYQIFDLYCNSSQAAPINQQRYHQAFKGTWISTDYLKSKYCVKHLQIYEWHGKPRRTLFIEKVAQAQRDAIEAATSIYLHCFLSGRLDPFIWIGPYRWGELIVEVDGAGEEIVCHNSMQWGKGGEGSSHGKAWCDGAMVLLSWYWHCCCLPGQSWAGLMVRLWLWGFSERHAGLAGGSSTGVAAGPHLTTAQPLSRWAAVTTVLEGWLHPILWGWGEKNRV